MSQEKKQRHEIQYATASFPKGPFEKKWFPSDKTQLVNILHYKT